MREDSIYTSMVPKLNHDMRVGHRSFQYPVDLSLAHRMASYVLGSFEHVFAACCREYN